MNPYGPNQNVIQQSVDGSCPYLSKSGVERIWSHDDLYNVVLCLIPLFYKFLPCMHTKPPKFLYCLYRLHNIMLYRSRALVLDIGLFHFISKHTKHNATPRLINTILVRGN